MSNKNLVILASVLVVVLGGGLLWKYGLFERSVGPAENGEEAKVSPALFGGLSKRLIGSAIAKTPEVKIKPGVPAYNLPLNAKDIFNWDQLTQKMGLSDATKGTLFQNGFVAFGKNEMFAKDDFADFYQQILDKDLPVFITSDTLLHYYHVFFDASLMRLEKDSFYDGIWRMSKRLYDDSLSTYQSASDPVLKEAAKRNTAYLSVALELLKPKPEQIVNNANARDLVGCSGPDEYCGDIYAKSIKEGTFTHFGENEAGQYSFASPDFVKQYVDTELALVKAHKEWDCSPTFLYSEDYSQYVPRGHYTKSEKLKNYFGAMMWYGRMTALLKGSTDLPEGKCSAPIVENANIFVDGFVSVLDAKIQTLQALLLTDKFRNDAEIQKEWQKIYAITSFYVGFSDDLGPAEYAAVMKDVLGEDSGASAVLTKLDGLQAQLAKLSGPKIYGGLGNAHLLIPIPPLTQKDIDGLKKQAERLLEDTKGFRLMGQRAVVDSEMFSKIVSPYSGEYNGPANKLPFTYVKTDMGREVRGFPRGLDIMALFGSERASEIIKQEGDASYSDYGTRFAKLKQQLDALPESEWTKNLYWNWLYVLKSLNTKPTNGWPTFMTTPAWQDKNLSTALASWAELRHDTILYAKQSYTMAEKGGGEEEPRIAGYVEPNAEFYKRMLDLTLMTRDGLRGLLTEEDWQKVGLEYPLEQFQTILSRLLNISKLELENKDLTDDDYNFIKYFGATLKSLNSGLVGGYQAEVDPDMFKNTLVADVHTDGNTGQVLEEGVGNLRPMLVAYKMPQGHILVGVGPIFSYYEFKHPMDDRLTDEKWRQMLNANPPAEQTWVSSFVK